MFLPVVFLLWSVSPWAKNLRVAGLVLAVITGAIATFQYLRIELTADASTVGYHGVWRFRIAVPRDPSTVLVSTSEGMHFTSTGASRSFSRNWSEARLRRFCSDAGIQWQGMEPQAGRRSHSKRT